MLMRIFKSYGLSKDGTVFHNFTSMPTIRQRKRADLRCVHKIDSGLEFSSKL